MAKAKAKEPQAPDLVDPEHELNPDVYRAPEPEPVAEEPVAETPAVEEKPTDG